MDLQDLLRNLRIVDTKQALSMLPDTVELSKTRLRYRYSVYCLEEQSLQLIRTFQRFHYGLRRHIRLIDAEAAELAAQAAAEEAARKKVDDSLPNLHLLDGLEGQKADDYNNNNNNNNNNGNNNTGNFDGDGVGSAPLLPSIPVQRLPAMDRRPIRPLTGKNIGKGGQEFHNHVSQLQRMSRRAPPPPPAYQVRRNWSAEQLSIGIIGASGVLGRRILERLAKHPEQFSVQDMIDEDNYQEFNNNSNSNNNNNNNNNNHDTKNNAGNNTTLNPAVSTKSHQRESSQSSKQQRLPYNLYLSCRVLPDYLEPYRQIPGIRLFDSNEAVMARCTVVLVCCPRHQIQAVLKTIRPQLTREKLIILVGAGWSGEDGWGLHRTQSVLGDGDRALALPTCLDYTLIEKLTKGLKHPTMFQDFFKSTGTSYPIATWSAVKERQTYETFMDLVCRQMGFICTLAELDICTAPIQRIISRSLRVKRLLLNPQLPVEPDDMFDEEADVDRRPLLQTTERYAWRNWLEDRQPPLIAVDWNYVEPAESTRPSTAATQSADGTRPVSSSAAVAV